MKTLFKISAIIILLIGLFYVDISFAGNIDGLEKIENSIDISGTSSDPSDTINNVGLNILSKVKYVFSGVLLIFLVYAGAQMVFSMGTDEDTLSKSKKTFLYSLIGLVFINIPGTLYGALRGDRLSAKGGIGSSWNNEVLSNTKNLFINIDIFESALNDRIIKFIEISLVAVAILVIIMAGLKILMSAGKEEKVTEAKNKIIWSIVGLIFVGFIEAWQKFAYSGKISDGTDIFKTIANLALFLAGPIAIFFLTLAGYYFITSNGDDEKIKKGKSIVINTILATAILLCSYIFLNDLITL